MKSRLVVQGSTIQNKIDHHIRLHFFGPKLEARLLSKTNLSSQSLQTINWLAIERAYKKQQLRDESAIFQLIHKNGILTWISPAGTATKTPYVQDAMP